MASLPSALAAQARAQPQGARNKWPCLLGCRHARRRQLSTVCGAAAAETEQTCLEDIRAVRLGKVDEIRSEGGEPFAYRFDRTHTVADLREIFSGVANGEQVAVADVIPGCSEIRVAGRLLNKRKMGKLSFMRFEDVSGPMQLYIDKGQLEREDMFNGLLKTLDVGDIIGAVGAHVKRTEKGELSVVPSRVEVLTKSLLPLPEKFHGLTDLEKRFRQRYLDMIATPGVRDTLRSRAKIISTIRRVLDAKGFIEVETPVLQSSAGGAEARPFVTYHNTLKRNFTLRIATELHLKQLVVGGFERVYEIGRIFRNEGVSSRHNPEFTSIELYQAYADYHDMMDLTEELFRASAMEVCGTLKVPYDDVVIDLEAPFRRASMHALVCKATGLDFRGWAGSIEEARAAAEARLTEMGVKGKAVSAVRGAPSMGHLVNELFEAVVEPTLMQPTFVMDHPVEISPLAKPHRTEPGLTERFELFVTRRELANAFSELTDPVEQRGRFLEQLRTHDAKREDERKRAAEGGHEMDQELDYEIKMDEDFLTALEHGMPPTGGLGIGIDRLVMLLTNSQSIREVIAFPLHK